MPTMSQSGQVASEREYVKQLNPKLREMRKVK